MNLLLIFLSSILLVQGIDFTNKEIREAIPKTGEGLNPDFWKTWFPEQDAKGPAAVDCTQEGYFPDPKYCQRFYRCVWINATSTFRKFDFTCAPWTLFDIDLNQCEHAENATTSLGCEYESVQPEAEDKEDNPAIGYEGDTFCVYDLRMHYLYGSPDGVLKRIIGFNGVFPGPVLRCTRGKTMVVRVTNTIEDEPTSIHWHGIEQHKTPWYDGPESITQCPIVKGTSMIYAFPLRQSGTYWYHSHHGYQYVDGAWGFLVIKNTPHEVWQNSYDKEVLISINDWTHRPAKNISEVYLTTGAFPDCNSSLINARGTFNCSNLESGQICNPALQGPAVIDVIRGLRYRIRVLSSAGARTYNFSIDGHKLVTIETDGVDTFKSPPFDIVAIQPAQRYSFLATMNQPLDEYWIRTSGEPGGSPGLLGRAILRYRDVAAVAPAEDEENEEEDDDDAEEAEIADENSSSLEVISDTEIWGAQGRPHFQDIPWDDVIANGGIQPPTREELAKFFPAALPSAESRQGEVEERHAKMSKALRIPTTSPVDPSTAVVLNQNDCPPYVDHGSGNAPAHYDQLVVITVADCPTTESPARQCMNGQPFIPGGTHSVPTLFQVIKGQQLAQTSRPIYTPNLREVIRIVINNHHFAPHPWHLHGHSIWVMGDGDTLAGDFNPTRDEPKLIRNGVRRDTSFTLGNSWAVFTYITNNPGVWFFHCHINWHLEAGLGVTFVEAQEVVEQVFRHPPLQSTLTCARVGVNLGLY